MSSMTVTMTTTKRATLKFDQEEAEGGFPIQVLHHIEATVCFSANCLCYCGNVLYDRKLSPCWRTALVTTGSKFPVCFTDFSG